MPVVLSETRGRIRSPVDNARMGISCSRRTRRSALNMPAIPPDASIIFLDVDGVLNSKVSRDTGDHLPASEPLDNLVHIISSVHAGTIVLSSTWRLDSLQRNALAHVLASVGLAFISATPDFSVSCKGDRVDEILSWLETHCKDGNRPWVALDDLDLLLMNPKLRPPHFVRTRDSIGLTRENADEAIRLLQAQRTGMIRSS